MQPHKALSPPPRPLWPPATLGGVQDPTCPRLGLRAHSTLYQQPPRRSSPGVHPAPHHTTLLWQNPSLPRSAQLPSLSHQPVGDKMPRVRDSSSGTATRELKLGRLGREEGGGKTSVFSVSGLMKPEQIVFISSSPSTKAVSPVTTSKLTKSHFWTCLPGRCQNKYHRMV